MDAQTLYYAILCFVGLQFLFNHYLGWLNLTHKPSQMPPWATGIMEEEQYQKGLRYQQEYYYFGLFQELLYFGIQFSLLFSGGFGYLADFLATQFSGWEAQVFSFFGIIMLFSTLLGLPFSLYGTFVIEEKYGFNKTNLRTFLFDKLKGMLLGIVIGGALGYVFFLLIFTLKAHFWIYFWAVSALFSLVINVFYTAWILPLFNKLTPLPEGELRTAIENYSHSVKFPLHNIFVIDGSKRSTKANAFFSGLGKRKKVVLYDTLLEKYTIDELVAIFAHEVGHYQKKHIPINLVIGLLQSAATLYLLSWFLFTPELSAALGAKQWAIHLNLMAFGMLFSPISFIINLGENYLSRVFEFQADAYAKATANGEALATALKKLSTDNLSNLTPHPWYVAFHYSHPPLAQRLAALRLPESSNLVTHYAS